MNFRFIEMVVGIALFYIIFMFTHFLHNPERYGDIMRRFDEARFHQVEDLAK